MTNVTLASLEAAALELFAKNDSKWVKLAAEANTVEVFVGTGWVATELVSASGR